MMFSKYLVGSYAAVFHIDLFDSFFHKNNSYGDSYTATR